MAWHGMAWHGMAWHSFIHSLKMPLIIIAKAGKQDAVKELLKAGASIEFENPDSQRRAVQYAVWEGKYTTVRLLCQAGANLDLIDSRYGTVRYGTVRYGTARHGIYFVYF